MPMRDILIQANSYPEPTPDWAMERSAQLANAWQAQITLGVCQVQLPPVSNWLANRLLDMDGVLAAENRRSRENQETLRARFSTLAADAQGGGSFVVHCRGTVNHWQLAVHARAHDLTIVPIYGHPDSVAVAEGLVFESGRPVLLLPETTSSATRCERIAIAWDGSRVAARAVADALPIVAQARSVNVVQVTGEKDLSAATPATDIVRHLTIHGIAAQVIDIEVEDGDVAKTLQAYCQREAHDLLVMGAFGHSRAREFVLGGATRSILAAPGLPIFISH